MENQRIVSEITHASNGVGVNMLAVTLGILSLGLFQAPLASLVSLALRDDRYSYTLLVPIISGFLLWLRKEDLLKRVRYSPMAGIPLLLAGLLIAAVPV